MYGNIYHASDPLGNKVYAWEDGCQLAKLNICTMGLMRELVRRACRYYRVRPPQVVPLGAKCRTSFYLPEEQRICFIPSHRNHMIAFHEAAHHICDVSFGDELPDHSAEWLSIYTGLLLKFEIFSVPFLRASLKPFGLPLRPRLPERLPR